MRIVVLVAIAVAALGCVASPVSPEPTQQAAASPQLPMTAAPSPVAATPAPTPASTSPTLAPSPDPLGSLDAEHVDPALEAVFPARIGDAMLIRFSQAGTTLSGGGDVCFFVCPDEPRLLVESVGATLDDLNVAVAYEQIDGHVGRYQLVAFRVGGITGAQLRAGRISMYRPNPLYPIVGDERVGGRTVTVAVMWWAPNNTEYLVVKDDVLIVIRAPSPQDTTGKTIVPALVADIVQALP